MSSVTFVTIKIYFKGLRYVLFVLLYFMQSGSHNNLYKTVLTDMKIDFFSLITFIYRQRVFRRRKIDVKEGGVMP